jgi:hypothetical protein
MRALTIAILVAAITVVSPAAFAQTTDGGRCAERFPESTFDTSAMADVVSVHGSGIGAELLDRYAREWGELVALVQDEMGGLDGGVAVCVFDDELPLDNESLGWPATQFLRAASFGQDRLVVVSSWLISEAPDAGRNGLLHVAQYQVSGGTYPEPFGDEVKGWYRNRVDRTVEAVHNVFVRQNSGLAEPWQPFPWTVGQMVDPLVWNPEQGYGGAGDFANYAVATGGTEVLSTPLTSDLASLDEGWRQTLFDESGAVLGGSRGWILGLVMSVGIVVLGILMAWWSRRQKLKIEEQLRDLEFLEQKSREAREAEAVRTSLAASGGGRHSRVRRGRSRASRVDRDDRDRSPSRRSRRSRDDRVSEALKTGDDLFRHPGFDEDD